MSYIVTSVGPNNEGKQVPIKIHLLHKETLDIAIGRVKKKNWDYVCAVCGLPGSGKSTFARVCAKYCDPTFGLDKIAFTAEEFVQITNSCAEFSAVVLDESFASLNSRTTMTPDFLKVINHLQIIRQKHLFIYLCLPNFFDLAKNIAIFRTSHLFVTYPDEEGNRGRFLAFDRDAKRKLFVKGMKFMDYNCIKANFIGDFWMNKQIVDEDAYEQMKVNHLREQEKKEDKKIASKYDRDDAIWICKREFHMSREDLSRVFKLAISRIDEIVAEQDRKHMK